MPSLITLSLSKLSSPLSSSLRLPPRLQPQHPSVAVSLQSFSTPASHLGLSCSSQRSLGSWVGIARARGGEEDPELEAEVLEFMKYSSNPNSFPNKQDLILSGRVDLAKRIVKQAGWLSYGWNLEDDFEEDDQEIENGRVGDGLLAGGDCRADQTRFDAGGAGDCNSSSCRMEGVGIEGILSRLEKERTQSYGIASNKGSGLQGSWNEQGKNPKLATQEVIGSEIGSSESWSSGNDMFDETGGFSDCGKPKDHLNADMWRKRGNRKEGVSKTEFQAAEFGEDIVRNDEMVKELSSMVKDYNHVISCLQEIALEIDSVLQLLQRTADFVVSEKVLKYSPRELHSLYDAWEFRETEINEAKNKLRLIRAKLAVLDGKKTLKIIEAQKMLVEKQKKISDRQKALSLLRPACVTWPKSASEVLLAGSFDGWASQRKMEKTSLGLFSMNLKLYPGQYEIKFLVDGVWAVDPLRPIVNSNGHKNNLLVVS